MYKQQNYHLYVTYYRLLTLIPNQSSDTGLIFHPDIIIVAYHQLYYFTILQIHSSSGHIWILSHLHIHLHIHERHENLKK